MKPPKRNRKPINPADELEFDFDRSKPPFPWTTMPQDPVELPENRGLSGNRTRRGTVTYEIARSRGVQDEWRVEAINHEGEGEIYVTLFSGPNAQQRAEEYAAWKMQAALPSPPPQESKP